MQVGGFIKNKASRLAVVGATSVFAVGVAFLSSGSAHAIGGLCNGTPASHTPPTAPPHWRRLRTVDECCWEWYDRRKPITGTEPRGAGATSSRPIIC